MRSALVAICTLAAAAYYPLAQAAASAPSGLALQRIERDKLCVTNGAVSTLPSGRLAVDTPSSRAVVRVDTAQSAAIRFRYLGPSESSKPLASGALRRQIGLKLKAQDTCNLLYAMWHIEPDSRIAVSVKRNAGQHTHEECGAGGYINIEPRQSVVMPKVLPGEYHTLRADLQGVDLTVTADGNVVWRGSVGNAIAEFDGPVGLRTDNARVEFDYYAGTLGADTRRTTHTEKVNRCSRSAGD